MTIMARPDLRHSGWRAGSGGGRYVANAGTSPAARNIQPFGVWVLVWVSVPLWVYRWPGQRLSAPATGRSHRPAQKGRPPPGLRPSSGTSRREGCAGPAATRSVPIFRHVEAAGLRAGAAGRQTTTEGAAAAITEQQQMKQDKNWQRRGAPEQATTEATIKGRTAYTSRPMAAAAQMKPKRAKHRRRKTQSLQKPSQVLRRSASPNDVPYRLPKLFTLPLRGRD